MLSTGKYPELLREVQQNSGGYGLDGSFSAFYAFVVGLDLGNDGLLLCGFREMLVVHFGAGNNLYWRGLILHLAFPDIPHTSEIDFGDPEVNRVATETMTTELLQYFELSRKHDGIREIFDMHRAFLQREREARLTRVTSRPDGLVP